LTGVIFHEPFGYLDYNKLQLESKCVISDSGTISEESAIIGFGAVTLRDSMERPEALETGSIVMARLGDGPALISAVSLALSSESSAQVPAGYEFSDFSSRVLNFVLSTAKLHKTWKNLN
jgi:UDP-N-acetylglucosamine 2-epimerase (non-hydrolysing)